ncbi:unnamed protein product [Moneuplotes crassus]|uniref:Uncharacterized protein n=1 Tax=Euplotes crassus TaxID=5936 RepID=A0AAD2D528_EUPCR|nr:unnamed protein product [Moneuplotes crassus]
MFVKCKFGRWRNVLAKPKVWAGRSRLLEGSSQRSYSRYASDYTLRYNAGALGLDIKEARAAEANPLKTLYHEKILRDLSEIQRLQRLRVQNEPQKVVNIKGLYPKIVMTGKCDDKTSDGIHSDNVNFTEPNEDLISEEEAIKIIYELRNTKKRL